MKPLHPVHLVSYSSQPDIQIKCDGDWDTPKWGPVMLLPAEVYLSEKLRYYTFNRDLANCEECLRG